MKSNILHIEDKRVRFSMRSVKIKMYDLGIKQHAVIVLYNPENHREVIHPFTQFILENWKYKAYNTQRVHANNLVHFLNWILLNKRGLKITSFKDISFEMGSKFLNELTLQGKKRDTVKSMQRTLTYYYYYLTKKELSSLYDIDDFLQSSNQHNLKNTYIIPPFKGVMFPTHVSDKNIAHMIPENYILPFIETAVRIGNPIALGVYMQIFGGIRQGELVNIRHSDINTIGAYGEDGLIIKLRENNLRPDIKDSSGSAGVKVERNQLVFPISNWLYTLYKNHIFNYKCNDNSDALFVNRNGNAMSGRTYRYYFDKVKEGFLQSLKMSDNPVDKLNALKLREYKFSTHLGRGIFSNLLAESAQNPYDIALPRGDKNLSSSMVYLGDTQRMKTNLEKRIGELYDGYLPNLINGG